MAFPVVVDGRGVVIGILTGVVGCVTRMGLLRGGGVFLFLVAEVVAGSDLWEGDQSLTWFLVCPDKCSVRSRRVHRYLTSVIITQVGRTYSSIEKRMTTFTS